MSGLPSSRLERALVAFLRFRSTGGSRAEFLAEHPDLSDLLEMMLADDEGDDEQPVADIVLGGDFRLEREIGRGGTGVVYAARQQTLDRRVAVKVLSGHLLVAPSTIARFRREARTIAGLSHPGIVRVLAVGSDRDTHWFAMELVEGSSLAARLATLQEQGERPAPWTRVMVQIAAHVADALHYVHGIGIVHRDVKPSNVLLRHDSTPVLTDFGLAHDDNAPTLTLPGSRAGTPCYMAPEQITGAAADIDPRTDVFALGATLYEMLTFVRPFDAGSPDGSMHRVVHAEPVDPRRFNPALSRDLAAIVGTALAKDPRHRYRSAGALADDLRAYLAGQPIHARPIGRVGRLLRWSRRNNALATALLGLFMALVVGLVTALGLWQTAANQERRAAALLSEWQRLADRRRLDELLNEADSELWPAVPEKIRAMDAWLERARRLAERRHDHQAALASLRRQPDAGEGLEEAAWRRQQLEDLVQRLAALSVADPHATTIASMLQRRQWAAELRWLTVERPAADWKAAIERVAAHPRYRGLELTEQLGLVPLGPDPRSGLEEFADPLTGDVPARGTDGELACGELGAVVFVLLAGGECTMGAQKTDPQGVHYDPAAVYVETPPHQVRLAPFLLAKFEVTQAEWRAVMGDLAGSWQPGRVVRGVTMGWRHPVANVTWELCETMCRRCGWVLPTEAQWEYACRAGSSTPWSSGADPESLLGVANLADEASRDEYPVEWSFHAGIDDGHAVPAPVGSYRPNGFGLHDMHGNVSEWCRDPMLRYDNSVEAGSGARILQPGRELRHGEMLESRVHRGGSCQSMASGQRSARRAAEPVAVRLPSIGFRPARQLQW